MGLSEKCIAPLVLGGIIAAGASLAGNAIGASSQNKTNQTSILRSSWLSVWILFSLGWSEQMHICFINLWGTIRNRNLSTLR